MGLYDRTESQSNNHIEIDLDNENFKLNKSSQINSSWYKEAEKRNFNLFLPNTEEK